jgi:4-amino-4-deoxy-L-arabinose transferase-like glycosyltransferase
LPGRALAAIFLIALVARLAAVTWAGWTRTDFGDGPAYLYAASEIARTGHYPIHTERFYFRAPGYPYFLVAVTLGSRGAAAIGAAKAANALLGALAPLLLAVLSARIFRSRTVAIVTGIAAALHPGLVSLSMDVESEPLYLVLLLAAAFLLLAASDRPSSNLAVLAGVALALAALTRPTALVLVPFLAAVLLDRRWPLRARAHLAASALLGFALALMPWTVRNAAVFHELLPVNDAAGSAFYQGNSDWAVRFYEIRSLDEYLRWSRAMFADLEARSAELDARGIRSPRLRSRYFVRAAFDERRAKPGSWPPLLLRKAADFVRPWPNPLFWPRGVVAVVGAIGAAVTALALMGLGFGLGAPARPGVRAFSIAFLAVTLAAHVALIVVWRYRIPHWDPVLLLYAVPGGARLVRR